MVPDQGAVEQFVGAGLVHHRSMIAFIRGIRTPLSTTVMAVSARIASNSAGHLPSGSRIEKSARQPASWRSLRKRVRTTSAVSACMAVSLATRSARRTLGHNKPWTRPKPIRTAREPCVRLSSRQEQRCAGSDVVHTGWFKRWAGCRRRREPRPRWWLG